MQKEGTTPSAASLPPVPTPPSPVLSFLSSTASGKPPVFDALAPVRTDTTDHASSFAVLPVEVVRKSRERRRVTFKPDHELVEVREYVPDDPEETPLDNRSLGADSQVRCFIRRRSMCS